MLHHYRRLIELRHTEPVVAHGDFTMRMAGDERVYAFTRRLGDVELFVLGNFSGADAAGRRGGGVGGRRAAARQLRPPPQDHATLRPWETRVYRRGG